MERLEWNIGQLYNTNQVWIVGERLEWNTSHFYITIHATLSVAQVEWNVSSLFSNSGADAWNETFAFLIKIRYEI